MLVAAEVRKQQTGHMLTYTDANWRGVAVMSHLKIK